MSTTCPSDATWRERQLMAASLAGPVRQITPFDAFVKLAGTRRPCRAGDSRVVSLKNQGAPSRRLRVLIAEDNPTNQIVVLHMIGRLGHVATLVGDGRGALETLDSGLFDVVLMDLQMPNMDGFDALASIRMLERQGKTHVPVIALTAEAMAGDRERCLAAGFDAYLAKPIYLRELAETIDYVLAPMRESGLEAPGPALAGSAFDREAALASVDGDEELFVQVAKLFLRDCRSRVGEIRQALNRGDTTAAGKLAHKLLGSAVILGAPEVVATAEELERSAAAGDCVEMASANSAFAGAVDRFLPALAKGIGLHRSVSMDRPPLEECATDGRESR